jgi:taurine transport system substrate-binding protein
MTAFTKVLAKAYADYNANSAKWTAASPELKSMAKLVGGTPADDAEALKLLSFPDARQQASAEWLGGGKSGKAVGALTQSAEFLKSQRQINTLLPDYASYVTAKYAEAAAK